MKSGIFNSAATDGPQEVNEELAELKRKVDRLSQMLKQCVTNEDDAGAISNESGPRIDMLMQHKAATEL